MSIAPDPNLSAIDGITQALKAAPPLAQNPGLAVPAGTSPDPVGTAQTLAYQTQLNGIQQGAQRVHHSHGLFGSVFSFFDQAGSDVAKAAGDGAHVVGQALNKPLQVAQHEYRYLHDIEARHGMLAAVGLGLGLLAVGVGTAVVAPEALAFLGASEMVAGAAGGAAAGTIGAELGGLGAGQTMFKDSWQRTADGTKYLDPNTHQPVSVGRDFASAVLGEKPGSATYKWVSGITDGLSDLGMDPLAKAGTITGGVRLARVTAMTGDDVVRLAETSPRVSRAIDSMVGMDAGQITANFPKLVEGDVATRTLEDGRQVSVPPETLAHQLGNATSRDEIIQILRDRVDSQGLSKGLMPNISLSGIPVQKVREWAASGSNLARFTGAGMISRGQQLLPEGFDPNTGALTNHDIDPYSGRAGLAIYRWLKGNGQSEAAAQAVATNFHNAVTYTDRIRIWRAAIFDAVKAQAVRKGMNPDEAAALSDEEFQRKLAGQFRSITGGEYPGQSSVYGYDHHGNLIPPVVDPSGAVRQAAVTDNQVGKISFPNHSDMRSAAAVLAGHRNLYGKADSFVYDHFTKTFFKRWVLSTGSFSAHVALSEMVLNSLRLGLRPMLQARLAASAIKGRIDDDLAEALADPEAQKSIAARMWHMMGGGYRAAASALTSEEQAKYALEVVRNNTFHGTIPAAARAGHSIEWADNTPEEVATHTMRDGIRRSRQIGSDDFSGFTPGENKNGEQVRAWQQALNTITKDAGSAHAARAYKMALDSGKTADEAHTAGAAAARQWLESHPELHNLYERANLPTQGWESMTPVEAWAHAKMLNVRGATTGANGTIHHDLLNAIEQGHFLSSTPQLPNAITRDMLTGIDDKPAKVLGRIYMPDPTSKLERVANNIHEFLARPIDFLSREPTYLANYAKYRKRFQPLIDDGRLSEEDAIIRSQSWAMAEMPRFVHNIHERTQLSEILRNYAPFWFAQQQAYKRVGRLLATDPGAFRKYQLMITGLHDVASNQTDAGGNNYVAFPGSGFIGSGTMGILSGIGLSPLGSTPVSFAGSLDSVSYIMPGAAGFRPDVGPIVAIPMKAIASMFPEMTPFASQVTGNITISEPMWKQFVPNSIAQHLIDALGANSRSFTSTMMYTIQTMDYEQNVAEQAWIKGGRKGPEPQIVPPANAGPIVQQQFINRIKNQTRIMYLIRAGLGLISPLAPQLTVKNFGFPAQLQAQIQKAGSVTAGVDAFLKQNPDATPFTVFQSTDPSGFALPDSKQAEAWINANMGLIHKYPYAAAWLMPQLTDTKYDPAVYNEQLAQGIRVKRTPQEFLNQLYIAAGNNTFYNVNRPVYEAALTSGQYNTTTLRSEWNQYIQQFGLQNPIWYDDYKSQNRITRRQETIGELRNMISDPAISSPMKQGVASLIQSWDTFQTALVSGSGVSKTDLADEYKAFLDGVAQSHPELKSFILSVLRPLAGTTSYVTTGVAA